MKFYVAGIKINEEFFTSPLSKVHAILASLHDINLDAIKTFGHDVITLVVLQENALTTRPITDIEKRFLLEKIQYAVNHFPNIVLIPGSLSTYQPLSAYDRNKKNGSIVKKNQILDNYQTILHQDKNNLIACRQIGIHADKAEEILSNPFNHHKITVLKNVSYLIKKDKTRIRHKKSRPFFEVSKANLDRDNCVYDIGKDNIINQIEMNGQLLEICLLVCYEHRFINQKANLTVSPLIELVVSASIGPEQGNFIGAINIQMDLRRGLSVYLNHDHDKIQQVDAIQATCYYLGNDKDMLHEPVTIKNIEELNRIKIRTLKKPVHHLFREHSNHKANPIEINHKNKIPSKL